MELQSDVNDYLSGDSLSCLNITCLQRFCVFRTDISIGGIWTYGIWTHRYVVPCIGKSNTKTNVVELFPAFVSLSTIFFHGPISI